MLGLTPNTQPVENLLGQWNSKRIWRFRLEINAEDLFKGLIVFKLQTQLGNIQSAQKKKKAEFL